MNHLIAEARPEHGNIINAQADVWKQVGDFDAAFAELPKRTFGTKQLCIVPDELILRFAELLRAWLTVELIKQRLMIERL